MHSEARFSSPNEQRERKSEAQQFREAIIRLVEKTKTLNPIDGGELESELTKKFGGIEYMPVHAETVQEVAQIMARHISNFEIKFNGQLYPEKGN